MGPFFARMNAQLLLPSFTSATPPKVGRLFAFLVTHLRPTRSRWQTGPPSPNFGVKTAVVRGHRSGAFLSIVVPQVKTCPACSWTNNGGVWAPHRSLRRRLKTFVVFCWVPHMCSWVVCLVKCINSKVLCKYLCTKIEILVRCRTIWQVIKFIFDNMALEIGLYFCFSSFTCWLSNFIFVKDAYLRKARGRSWVRKGASHRITLMK